MVIIVLVGGATAAGASDTKHRMNAAKVRLADGHAPVGTTVSLRHAEPTRPRAQIHEAVRFGPGPAVRDFVIREPAGTIKLLRLIVPRGDSAQLSAVIPGVAEVSISTTAQPPNPVCGPRAGSVSCLEPEEQCPMPAATWQFRLQQIAGPGGTVRVQFKVD